MSSAFGIWFIVLVAACIAAPYAFRVAPKTRRQWMFMTVAIAFIAWLLLPLMMPLRSQSAPQTAGTQASLPRASSAEEKVHALLHDRGFEGKPPLPDGGVWVTVLLNSPRLLKRPTIEDFLTEQVCGSAVVVEGTVAASKSMLNNSGTFLFSDYRIAAQDVIHKTATVRLQPGPITTTRLGGMVVQESRQVGASYNVDPILALGHRYIFFLDAVVGSSAFQKHAPLDYIEDQGRQIAILGDFKTLPEAFLNPSLTFAEVSQAAKTAATHCK